jgi:two-component system, OmpR family, sensor histidine kinase AdeS
VIGRVRNWRLRSQLTLGIVALACLTFVFIRQGSYALDDHFFNAVLADLPPRARAAYESINQFRMPDFEDLRELNRVWPKRIEAFQRQTEINLYLLFGVSCLLMAGAAYLVAVRLASPIEKIAEGARRLSAGELSVRIGNQGTWPREAQSLVEDFNQLASSLSASQRAFREANAAIAHELRTPLTILRGRLQGMRDGLFGRSPSDIDGLILQVDALTRIVEDLRVLSLSAASELSVHALPVDLADRAESLLDVLAPDLDGLGMRVERDLRPAPMAGDGQRLGQAILALVDNARRYGASGGVLRVETGLDGDEAFIRVIDHGPGFPPGTGDAAFEPFWRADPSRSRAAGGSGLGLAVVKAIVDAHHGSVRIAGNVPSGAMVELRFKHLHAA